MTYTRPIFPHGDGHYSPVNTPEGEYPTPLYHAMPNAMGKDFAHDFIEWTAENRSRFVRGGDREHRRDVEVVGVESCGRFGEELHRQLLLRYHDALEDCHVDPFSVTWCEMNAIGYLDGDRFNWHTDHFQSSVNLRHETKAITFLYYAHQEPLPFEGGGLEFADGTVIAPENDLLLWINPYQRHRVLEVAIGEDADPWRGGRWTLAGWLHKTETGLELPKWHKEPGAPSNYVSQ